MYTVDYLIIPPLVFFDLLAQTESTESDFLYRFSKDSSHDIGKSQKRGDNG